MDSDPFVLKSERSDRLALKPLPTNPCLPTDIYGRQRGNSQTLHCQAGGALAELLLLGGLLHVVARLVAGGLRPLAGGRAALAVGGEAVAHHPVQVELVRRLLGAALPAGGTDPV